MGLLSGKSSNDVGSQICEGVELSGDFYFPKRVYIGGVVKGKVRAETLLEVGPTGRIEAEADVRNISIQGEFQGTIRASERVEIHKEGKVHGEIFSPCLIIESGAFFEGHCNMGGTENSTRSDSSKKHASKYDNDKKDVSNTESDKKDAPKTDTDKKDAPKTDTDKKDTPKTDIDKKDLSKNYSDKKDSFKTDSDKKYSFKNGILKLDK